MAPVWEDVVDSPGVPRGWGGVDEGEKGGELRRRDGVVPGGGLNKDAQIGRSVCADLMPLMTTTRALLGVCVRARACERACVFSSLRYSSKHFPEHLPSLTSRRFLPVILDF